LCFRPDGKELAATTLKGEIYFWEVENMYIFFNIILKKNEKIFLKGRYGVYLIAEEIYKVED